MSKVTRLVEITNCYELHDTVVTEVSVVIDSPEGYSPSEYDDYLFVELFQYTGTGHEDGNAFYDVRSIDNLDPPIKLQLG